MKAEEEARQRELERLRHEKAALQIQCAVRQFFARRIAIKARALQQVAELTFVPKKKGAKKPAIPWNIVVEHLERALQCDIDDEAVRGQLVTAQKKASKMKKKKK